MAIGSHGRGRGGTVGDGRLAIGRRPCRPAPTVPPRPVTWPTMAMADLTGTGAVGIASHRARAQGSQPPSPVGDVGKRKQLALLYSRTPLAVGMTMQLPIV